MRKDHGDISGNGIFPITGTWTSKKEKVLEGDEVDWQVLSEQQIMM
jgi:hypothetical protein